MTKVSKIYGSMDTLNVLRANLESKTSGSIEGRLAQLGINMVDLMMWLVIAALLLAAALQGIGYYQQAAWTFQAKSDVASVRTFMEAQYTMRNNQYPNIAASDNAALASSNLDLKLTSDNRIIAARSLTGTGWTATLVSKALHEGGKPAFFNFGSADNTATAGIDESGNNIQASTSQLLTVISD